VTSSVFTPGTRVRLKADLSGLTVGETGTVLPCSCGRMHGYDVCVEFDSGVSISCRSYELEGQQ